MAYGSLVAEQRFVAVRLVLGSLGALVCLLVVLALVRPDMAMSALHHMEAMMAM